MSSLASKENIVQALPFIGLKWGVQNDAEDKATRFIYYCKRLDQVISLAESNEVSIGYAIHRWFNFQCSKMAENLFCENGAKHFDDEYDHDVDITIDGIPFDVKLSVISDKYEGNTDLSKRENKDKYIEWLKENASQEGRKHTKNKIYIICENQELKCDFDQMNERISKFVGFFLDHKDEYLALGEEICEILYLRC